jgi:hypothetical protein
VSTPTARTLTILRRFPRHLEVDDPGKLFTDVVNGLGGELDVKSVQLGRVRRSHALGDADEERDVFLLAGLHDLKTEDLDVTRLRLDALRAVETTLSDDSATPDDKTAAAAKLQDLLGLAPDAFPAWPTDGADPGPVEARIATSLGELVSYPSELDLLRGSVESVIELHRAGNGTVRALLGASATYLELALESIVDTDDLYWHVAECRDLMRVVRPEPPGSTVATTEVVPKTDLLALEENPLRRQDSDPVDRRNGDRFNVLRSGFETVPATVRVVGVGDRTVEPMVVNLDAGFGVVYTGSVPDGEELRFESDGRAAALLHVHRRRLRRCGADVQERLRLRGRHGRRADRDVRRHAADFGRVRPRRGIPARGRAPRRGAAHRRRVALGVLRPRCALRPRRRDDGRGVRGADLLRRRLRGVGVRA